MSDSGETFNSVFMAGQISQFVYNWKGITHDPWILHIVQGFNLPFLSVPIQLKEPNAYRLSEIEKQAADLEIEKLIQKGVLEQVEDSQGQVLSNIFLRPKKDGSFRMILDLTWVNKHIQYQHFKMSSLNTATQMLREGCWMASIDLKDAYYSVPIAVEDRKFLRFRWKGNLYQYTVMPNGLACAPLYFTKLLNPVFAYLRSMGHECFQYIDDSFIVADTFHDCLNSIYKVKEVLESLGFVVHPEKSIFQPMTKITFLGFDLDSQTMIVSLNEDKVEKFKKAALQVLGKEFSNIREIAGLVGLMVSYTKAFDYAWAHVKSLERDKIEALKLSKGNFDVPMSLSHQSKEDIIWWLNNIDVSGKHLNVALPEVVLFTDASEHGWGAHVEAKTAGGRWTDVESQFHINVLELKAIFLALKALCRVKGMHVKVMTDNTTALAYIKHMGGVRSSDCDEVARQIWSWCETNAIWITIAHIPGKLNVVADYKSRHFSDNVEWKLRPQNFDHICDIFGHPDVDLFASRLNKQIDVFVSWHPDPDAFAVDAFTMSWANTFFYAFPPFSCVARCISKILKEGACGILVVPWWPTQTWWARLINLKLRRIKFRTKKDNLLPIGKPKNENFLNKCPLGAFLFSLNHS